MATRAYNLEADAAKSGTRAAGAGWLTFASVMLGLAGTYSVIYGILAISNSKVFTANTVYVFSDLNTWGWITLVLGCLELLAAFTLLAGSGFAKWFTIFAASVNAIAQLMFIPAYPFWSLALFSLDIWVIYAVAVYAGSARRVR